MTKTPSTPAWRECGYRIAAAEHPRISTECSRPANHDGPHSDRIVSVDLCLACADGDHQTCYGDDCHCYCAGRQA